MSLCRVLEQPRPEAAIALPDLLNDVRREAIVPPLLHAQELADLMNQEFRSKQERPLSPESWTRGLDVVQLLVNAAVGMGAALIGVRVGLRQTKEAKRLDFIEVQLRDLYSPLLGRLRRIRASSALRVELADAANQAWIEVQERDSKDWRGDRAAHEAAFRPYAGLIDRDNRVLRDTLVPLYVEMREVFTKNFWLASSETQRHYAEFCRFVEIWEASLAAEIPGDVSRRVQHAESRLDGFYADLIETVSRLRQELGGSARPS